MYLSTNKRLADVLFVEDSFGDVLLTQAILKTSRIIFNMHIARDGVEALTFMDGVNRPDGIRPDLILLDFNLPKKNGVEVLDSLKQSEISRDIPVLMLSGSDDARDVEAASRLGAAGYIIKPIQENVFMQSVASLDQLGFERVGDESRLVADNMESVSGSSISHGT